MDPTSPQPSANAPAPNAGAPLVEYIRTSRSNAGYALVVLSAVFLVLTGFLVFKAYRAPATPDAPADKPLAEKNPFEPDKPPELPKAGATANLKRGDYTVGWIGTVLGFLICAAAGAWLLVNVSPAGEEKQRTEARVVILAVGGLLGSVLILFGLWYFYKWSDSLVSWLDKGETKEARWVLIPILMAVTGAGLVFMAIQPARAEERNNTLIRRLVYGSNFALTVLLLLVALVVVNVLFAVRVPNKLDTTETGFYSISDNTVELLRRLDPPVTAYAIIRDNDNRMLGDIRQFLLGCQDSSDGRFKVRFISPVADKKELGTLLGKYPKLELVLAQRGSFGAVVLATGPDESRSAVIPVQEFFSAAGEQMSFEGEARLFKELTLLADNQVKPVVYFTQSNGELSVAPESDAPDRQKAARLKAYLERNYLDVRPLALARENPTIPDDAAVVVIAGPQVPFSEAAVGALRKYVNTPRAADGKKGKLVVLAGVVPGPGGKGVMKTGLEGLLGELNVRLGERFVYTEPTERSEVTDRPELEILARFTNTALREGHPVALAIARATRLLRLVQAREVAPLTAAPGVQARALLETADVTWLEESRLTDVIAAIRQMAGNVGLQRAKEVTEDGRPLAAVVSEGGSARAAVFGSSDFVSDFSVRTISPDGTPLTFVLIGATIDWIRERPPVAAVGIEAKKYREYTFPEPAGVDTTRLLYLPLALGFLAVAGLGAGVWVVRRR